MDDPNFERRKSKISNRKRRGDDMEPKESKLQKGNEGKLSMEFVEEDDEVNVGEVC